MVTDGRQRGGDGWHRYWKLSFTQIVLPGHTDSCWSKYGIERELHVITIERDGIFLGKKMSWEY